MTNYPDYWVKQSYIDFSSGEANQQSHFLRLLKRRPKQKICIKNIHQYKLHFYRVTNKQQVLKENTSFESSL